MKFSRIVLWVLFGCGLLFEFLGWVIGGFVGLVCLGWFSVV